MEPDGVYSGVYLFIYQVIYFYRSSNNKLWINKLMIQYTVFTWI